MNGAFLAIARKEFRDRVRSRWVWVVAIVFALFSLAIAFLGGAAQGAVGIRSVAAAQGEALGWRAWPQTVWLAVCFMGVLATALGYTWYSEAVHRLGAARAALFINLVPVAGVVTGWLLLDEPLSWPVLVGGLLVLTGVTLTTQKPKERGRVTE